MTTSNSIFSVLDPKTIAGLIDRRIPLEYKGLELFKSSMKNFDGMFDLEFDVRYGRIPRAPMTSQKAPTPPIRNGKIKKLLITPPCIKAHDFIYEYDAARMRMPGGLQAYGDAKMKDSADIIGKAIQATKEWMVWQSLRGSLVYNNVETGLQFNINFGQDPSHLPVLTGGDKWDAPATCDPISNLENWVALIERDCGFTPTMLVMNRFTLAKAMKAQSFQSILTPTLSGGALLSAFKEYIKTTANLALEVYQGPYEAEDGTDSYMVEDGELFLAHPSALLIGSGASEYNKSGANSYKAGAWTDLEEKKDPLGVKVMGGENAISALVLPGAAIRAKVY